MLVVVHSFHSVEVVPQFCHPVDVVTAGTDGVDTEVVEDTPLGVVVVDEAVELDLEEDPLVVSEV